MRDTGGMMMVAHMTKNPRYPFNKRCEQCGILYTVYVDPQDYADWYSGNGLIQDIMPYLSEGERELLISSCCGSCFDQIFGLDTDEE
jgi:hypothetical protein